MSDMSDLAANVRSLESAEVLVIGDVMLDRFVYGSVERISPEAPIPVVRIKNEIAMLGGAGNVARNVAGLGAVVHFVAAVGTDAAGNEVQRLVSDLPRSESSIVADARRKTSIKTRYIAAGQQMLRADDETILALGPQQVGDVLDHARHALRSARVMILADYAKGVLGQGTALKLIELARVAKVPVIVDPQGSDYEVYRGATLVTPNRAELALATGMAVGTDAEIIAAACSLIDRFGIAAVLATRSADGMTLVAGPEKVEHFPAEAREVFDVSGAGDTVVAALGSALAAGLPMGQAVRLANVAAGIVVGKVGTAVAYADDIDDALRHSDAGATDTKVKDIIRAQDLISLWRRQGHRIGLATGCFDLLHPGHLTLIQQAKAQCDRLIVGLNSDASTARLKGPTRPIQNESVRAQMLAALEAVDLAIVFEEDTPAQLIEAIKPDVFVKGADYTVDRLPEAKIVQGYGGKIVLAQLAAGHSTTSTIAKMNAK
jgi:D-beta-D-heptose 7-phosphate kinase/D-beta-D-heptose 1-phosphate adenosyltransferase